MTAEEIISCFRDERYQLLNQRRWDHFKGMGISLEGKTIFEPGAGIGDQTEWLLENGARLIYVNEGRWDNLQIIATRFANDKRVILVHSDLEMHPEFSFSVDFVFCYGVYYHLSDPVSDFGIMRQLSRLGDMIAFDYLAGNDSEVHYGYENPSVSMSHFATRPRPETLTAALKEIWGYAYLPKEPLVWVDPLQAEDRRVMVASHSPLDNPNLILQ